MARTTLTDTDLVAVQHQAVVSTQLTNKKTSSQVGAKIKQF